MSNRPFFFHVEISVTQRAGKSNAAAQGLSDPNLLDFAAYSADFFRACCLRQALAAIAGDDAPEQLADFFAAANAAYFSGRMDTLARDSALEKRWQAQSGFLPLYLADILSQPPADSQRDLPKD